MRHRFDRIGKDLLRGALEPGGAVATELEVPTADAQAVDTWFEPAPERQAERQRAGLLGRMAETPTMFEPFHDPPSLDEVRGCVRKQLALDHHRALEARKQGRPRPAFPRLWALSTGRPDGVLAGYGLTPIAGWPPGFYEGRPAEAMGVVVLRELPREHETLLLRLMGSGAVLRAAIEDLKRLPDDAWEREVAVPALLAARSEMAHDSNDESEREYLMTTQKLYEQLKADIRERCRQEERQAAHQFFEQREAVLLEQARQETQQAAERLFKEREAAVREQARQEARQAAERFFKEWEAALLEQKRQEVERLLAERKAAMRDEGRQEGQAYEARRALTLLYQARFGPLPPALRDELEATTDTATLERWLLLVGTRSEQEVVASLRAERGEPAP
ncbi:MAG TPA: hypothetical protein VFS00_25725 [Polyangiaceae bacterium]|nr:hypothetical protein [Polyangiaceae bacterium]